MKETRFKVRRNINVADLQNTLNGLSAKGWTIRDVISQSAFRFAVVAYRNVRVR